MTRQPPEHPRQAGRTPPDKLRTFDKKARAHAAEQKLAELRDLLPLYAEINERFTELNSKLTKLASE